MNRFALTLGVAGALLCAALNCLAMSGVTPGVLRVPADTAYTEPDADPPGMEVTEERGITGWADAKQQIVWYGTLKAAGPLTVALSIRLPQSTSAAYRLTVSRLNSPKREIRRTARTARGSTAGVTAVDFGMLSIPAAGPYRFAVEGLSKQGLTFGEPQALLLGGPAAAQAHFSRFPGRGAPSVHLWYPLPDSTKAAWFYNEVTVKTDPVASYYMACGFARGYFGIQVNSPTERRIIFSVWDSGDEPADRSKVAAEDQVQLVAKGPGVFVSGFGNEGTGGHSHLVYPWKTGRTYRFLVTAQPQGSATIYSGYFYFPERKAWGLIASFRAPQDGGYLHGLYSFNEDFWGANGQRRRLAEFGPQWVKTTDGRWIELTTARFTHTADAKTERLDRGAGVQEDRFFLTNGGFIPMPDIRYGDTFTRTAAGKPPAGIVLPGAGGTAFGEKP